MTHLLNKLTGVGIRRAVWRRIVRPLLHAPRLNRLIWKTYYALKYASATDPQGCLEVGIPEITPLVCRKSTLQVQRLNLLLPALGLQHIFGGISTALHLFDALAKNYDHLRIILTDQQVFSHQDNPAFAAWQILHLDDADCPGHCIIPAGDRYGRTLAVAAGDRFMATAWWTAYTAGQIQTWQTNAFGWSTAARYLYLIQDYEPGFYPWSSRYTLAEATYHQPERFVAIFNTALLQRFFKQQQYDFPVGYAFEPTLNPRLGQLRKQVSGAVKEQRVLIYGRPGTERNAFELIVMALRSWVAAADCSDWTFVSAGEEHAPVSLGNGRQLIALGKLSLEDYATELSRAALGISLMISPHPSYPPLEMAAFGLTVITNSYGPKDLSTLHQGILTVSPPTPEAIAEKLSQGARLAFSGESVPQPETTQWRRYLEGDGSFAALADTLVPYLVDATQR